MVNVKATQPSPQAPRPLWRWALLGTLLLAFILVPFFLLEEQMNAIAQGALRSDRPLVLITLAVVALLLADIALPIPSSFVLATTGFLLGPAWGTAVCFIGLSCASAAGYALGRWAGEPVCLRIVGRAELNRFAALSQRHGDALLVAMRALPVLAEATTLLAGVARMPVLRFAALVSIGNAVVAALYAGIGALSASQSSFWLLSLAAMVLPLLIMLVMRRFMPARAQHTAGADRPPQPPP